MTLHWRFIGHINLNTEHVLSQRCVEYPQAHRETVTKYRHGYPVEGSGKMYYFIDEPRDEHEYASVQELLRALGVET
jgi:hypothetical protein